MSTGWENHEAAPLEFFHSKLMNLFHEWRVEKFGQENTEPKMSGIDLNNIITKAKIETYNKYPKQVSSKAILKTDL